MVSQAAALDEMQVSPDNAESTTLPGCGPPPPT